MPVTVDAELQELPYDMASRVAFDVMHDVFAVHNEFGRFMDMLAQGSFVFELKTVEKLNHRHRSQLLNYVMLADLRHGKLVNLLGGKERVMTEIDIVMGDRTVGRQKIRLSGRRTAFKITALGDDGMMRFEDHARRFLQHTRLRSIHWINVTRASVTFRTLDKERTGR